MHGGAGNSVSLKYEASDKKRQKDREALIKQVEKGDKVITSSGMHGTVAQVEDTTVLLQVSDNTKIRIEKSAINTINPKGTEKAA